MENSEKENKTKTPPPRLNMLQLTQNTFATVGISPTLSLQPYPINAKILLGLLILSLYFVSNFVYTIIDAKTFAEYTESFM